MSSVGGCGSDSPSSQWENVGSSVTISTNGISSSCAFNGWTGSGTGSYSGSSSSATVTISGPITETANFQPLYTVTFTESGLPSGTSWSVTFGGAQSPSTTTTISFSGVASGLYSFSTLTPVTVGQTQVLCVSFIRIDECPIFHITIDLILGVCVLSDDECWCRWNSVAFIGMGQLRLICHHFSDA